LEGAMGGQAPEICWKEGRKEELKFNLLFFFFSLYECVRWAVFQMKEGQLTLRISKKNNRDKPKILRQVGKTDKLIKDYLEIYEKFRNF